MMRKNILAIVLFMIILALAAVHVSGDDSCQGTSIDCKTISPIKGDADTKCLNSNLKTILSGCEDDAQRNAFLDAQINKISDLRSIELDTLHSYMEYKGISIDLTNAYKGGNAISFDGTILKGPFGQININHFPNSMYSLKTTGDKGENLEITSKTGGKTIVDGGNENTKISWPDPNGEITIDCSGGGCDNLALTCGMSKCRFVIKKPGNERYDIELHQDDSKKNPPGIYVGKTFVSSCDIEVGECYDVSVMHTSDKGKYLAEGEIYGFEPAKFSAVMEKGKICDLNKKLCFSGRLRLNAPEKTGYTTIKATGKDDLEVSGEGDVFSYNPDCKEKKELTSEFDKARICVNKPQEPDRKLVWKGINKGGTESTFRVTGGGNLDIFNDNTVWKSTGLFIMNRYDSAGYYVAGGDSTKYENLIKSPGKIEMEIQAVSHPTINEEPMIKTKVIVRGAEGNGVNFLDVWSGKGLKKGVSLGGEPPPGGRFLLATARGGSDGKVVLDDRMNQNGIVTNRVINIESYNTNTKKKGYFLTTPDLNDVDWWDTDFTYCFYDAEKYDKCSDDPHKIRWVIEY